MKVELLIESIERCITISKKTSDDLDNNRCSAMYAVGVYEDCMRSVERYIKYYMEDMKNDENL